MRGNGQRELSQLGPTVFPAEKCPEKEKSSFSCLVSASPQCYPRQRVPRERQCEETRGASPSCPLQGASTALFQRRAVIYFNRLCQRYN